MLRNQVYKWRATCRWTRYGKPMVSTKTYFSKEDAEFWLDNFRTDDKGFMKVRSKTLTPIYFGTRGLKSRSRIFGYTYKMDGLDGARRIKTKQLKEFAEKDRQRQIRKKILKEVYGI